MEEKENRKIARTKQLLSDALTGMLKEMPLHAVSIRELCQRAGINRTTFYNHYGSQYDLLNEIAERFLTDIAQQLSFADASSRESVQERVTTVFSYLEEHLTLSRLLLSSNADKSFAEKLFSLPKITDLLDAALRECEDETTREAVISFAIHGSYHLLLDWIRRDERIPADRQAAMILELARRVCSQDFC